MHDRLLILVPTRDRPHNAAVLTEAWRDTTTGCSDLLFLVDDDEPQLDAYAALREEWPPGPGVGVVPRGRTGFVDAINDAANTFAADYFALAFLGDDHRPRTQGWDDAWLASLHQDDGKFRQPVRMVYSDDLLMGARMPTAIGITSTFVHALGWLAPPSMQHLNVDIAWKELGDALGIIEYLPHFVVEHMHPANGKAPNDAGYERVNAPNMVEGDGDAWTHWINPENTTQGGFLSSYQHLAGFIDAEPGR